MENLKKLSQALGTAATFLGKVGEDGKIGLSDLPELMALVATTYPILNDIDFSKITDEFENLTDGQKTELLESFRLTFDLEDDTREENIEEALGHAIDGVSHTHRAVRDFRAMSERLRGDDEKKSSVFRNKIFNF